MDVIVLRFNAILGLVGIALIIQSLYIVQDRTFNFLAQHNSLGIKSMLNVSAIEVVIGEPTDVVIDNPYQGCPWGDGR